jgi:cellulose synthase/poly-beta-1,6-N-acetylglucosamine synthase-like glycosyltransferase
MVGLFFWLCVAGILYVYIGYPVLVTLLARLRPKPAAYPSYTPSVSLLIAAYNEEQVIAQKIENTLALDYPASLLQVIVVADGSDDQTPELVRKYAQQGVELLYEPARRGKLAAINRGVSVARNDILVFSDANNIYEKGTLRELVTPFIDPLVGAVAGAKHVLKGDGALGDVEGLYWKYESFIKDQETRLGSCTGVSGEILAIRRRLYPRIPKFVINDDFFIALAVIRHGYHLLYSPQARSFERVSLSAKDEVTRRTRIIAGRYQAMMMTFSWLPWKHPIIVWQVVSHKFLRPLVPFWMLFALAANLAAVLMPAIGGRLDWIRLAPPYNWIFFVSQLVFYILALVGDHFRSGKGVLKFFYLPAFLVNSNLAALYGLVQYISGKPLAAWQRVARRSLNSLK